MSLKDDLTPASGPSTATLSILTVKATQHNPLIRRPNVGLLAGVRYKAELDKREELCLLLANHWLKNGVYHDIMIYL